MKKVLVVGATGFVGSHTLRWLRERDGVDVIAACRDRKKLPADFSGEVREGDLRDAAYLATLLEGVDVVVDAMAWSSLYGHAEESERLFLRPAMALVDAFFASDAERFVNISSTSAAVPGDAQDALSPGVEHAFWPHLSNVVRVENALRQKVAQATGKTVVNLRLGIFVGEHYSLGVLPILLPRLKTHLVPWVAGGRTELPLTDGRDLGQAMGRAALQPGLEGYESFNIVGPEVPTVREVIEFLHHEFGYPRPHFGVPFALAYPFAWLMEKLDRIVPWEPLIVRSIVHLLENTGATNHKASARLGYSPQHHWEAAVRLQIAEMEHRQTRPMSMVKPVE